MATGPDSTYRGLVRGDVWMRKIKTPGRVFSDTPVILWICRKCGCTYKQYLGGSPPPTYCFCGGTIRLKDNRLDSP
jgi:hypothetical protein